MYGTDFYNTKAQLSGFVVALNFLGIWKQTWWLFGGTCVFVPKTSRGFQYIFLFWLDLGFLKDLTGGQT